MNYYEILGVSQKASDDEIKKAFRQMSLLHHPDRPTGDEAKFKQLSEAYNILSDPDKRREYDQQLNPSHINAHFDDIFSSIFGAKSHVPQTIPLDIELTIELTLAEFYLGTQVRKAFIRQIQCIPCNGLGHQAIKCSPCQGTGRTIVSRKPGMQMAATCGYCLGLGKVKDSTNPCKACLSKGYTTEEAKHLLNIPPGSGHLHQTTILTAPGLGNKIGNRKGSLHLYISVVAQTAYRQAGEDLIYIHNTTLSELCLGNKVNIELPDKSNISVTIPPSTDLKSLLRVKEKGLMRHHSAVRGDLFIEFNLTIPSNLTLRQKELLEELRKTGL